MRVAVITDAHANLPALRATIEAVQSDGCDIIFHTGDAIGLGPSPAECLELLIERPRTHCLLGNHEYWLIHGLPTPPPRWMDGEALQNLLWTQDQIPPTLRAEVEGWPYELMREFDGISTQFSHYPLDSTGTEFLEADKRPTSADLDRVFDDYPVDILFFGHHHHPVHEIGQRRYVNPGSLGLHDHPLARYAIVDFRNGRSNIQHRETTYDDRELFALYEDRIVPGRDFICRTFFGKEL